MFCFNMNYLRRFIYFIYNYIINNNNKIRFQHLNKAHNITKFIAFNFVKIFTEFVELNVIPQITA